MEDTFIIVFFQNCTIVSYEIIDKYDILPKFLLLCEDKINERADLDIRSHFITYSDDCNMVQLIGPITSNLTQLIQSEIAIMRYVQLSS